MIYVGVMISALLCLLAHRHRNQGKSRPLSLRAWMIPFRNRATNIQCSLQAYRSTSPANITMRYCGQRAPTLSPHAWSAHSAVSQLPTMAALSVLTSLDSFLPLLQAYDTFFPSWFNKRKRTARLFDFSY